MSVELDISVGDICALPVLSTGVSVNLISGPAYLCGWSFRESSGNADLAKGGSVTSPGATTNIVSQSGVPAGRYKVSIVVSLQGAAAAADANNFQLQAPGGQTFQLTNPGAAGEYEQEEIVVTSASSGAWNVRTIGAGTAGVVYGATISLTVDQIVTAVGELVDGNNPLGEISCEGLNASNAWFGGQGLWVRNQITLNMVSGFLQGAVYARYPQ